MYVSRNAADCMQISSGRINDRVRQIMVKPILDLWAYHWQAIFRVPGDMEIDFGVDAG